VRLTPPERTRVPVDLHLTACDSDFDFYPVLEYDGATDLVPRPCTNGETSVLPGIDEDT
jgi:hypothetical protein